MMLVTTFSKPLRCALEAKVKGFVLSMVQVHSALISSDSVCAINKTARFSTGGLEQLIQRTEQTQAAN